MASKRTKSIGVFDSGLGGLTVLKALQKKMPQYRYVYLADSARAPYGDRSASEVLQYAKQAVDFLFAKNCDLVVFACNTVSAEALRTIQQTYLHQKHGTQKRVLGVIVPTAEYIAEKKQHARIGVIGTQGTVRSETFPREILKLLPSAKVFQEAAPLLVPLVESGERDRQTIDTLVKEYVRPLLKKKIDTLVLGCTHYGHLIHYFQRAVGKSVTVIAEERIIAPKLATYLKRHPEIESSLKKSGGTVYFSTGARNDFKRMSAIFFGKPVSLKRAKLA